MAQFDSDPKASTDEAAISAEGKSPVIRETVDRFLPGDVRIKTTSFRRGSGLLELDYLSGVTQSTQYIFSLSGVNAEVKKDPAIFAGDSEAFNDKLSISKAVFDVVTTFEEQGEKAALEQLEQLDWIVRVSKTQKLALCEGQELRLYTSDLKEENNLREAFLKAAFDTSHRDQRIGIGESNASDNAKVEVLNGLDSRMAQMVWGNYVDDAATLIGSRVGCAGVHVVLQTIEDEKSQKSFALMISPTNSFREGEAISFVFSANRHGGSYLNQISQEQLEGFLKRTHDVLLKEGLIGCETAIKRVAGQAGVDIAIRSFAGGKPLKLSVPFIEQISKLEDENFKFSPSLSHDSAYSSVEHALRLLQGREYGRLSGSWETLRDAESPFKSLEFYLDQEGRGEVSIKLNPELAKAFFGKDSARQHIRFHTNYGLPTMDREELLAEVVTLFKAGDPELVSFLANNLTLFDSTLYDSRCFDSDKLHALKHALCAVRFDKEGQKGLSAATSPIRLSYEQGESTAHTLTLVSGKSRAELRIKLDDSGLKGVELLKRGFLSRSLKSVWQVDFKDNRPKMGKVFSELVKTFRSEELIKSRTRRERLKAELQNDRSF